MLSPPTCHVAQRRGISGILRLRSAEPVLRAVAVRRMTNARSVDMVPALAVVDELQRGVQVGAFEQRNHCLQVVA